MIRLKSARRCVCPYCTIAQDADRTVQGLTLSGGQKVSPFVSSPIVVRISDQSCRLASRWLGLFTLLPRSSSWTMYVSTLYIPPIEMLTRCCVGMQVLAALDVHTAKWIVDKCFSGDLIQGRTILLVVSPHHPSPRLPSRVLKIILFRSRTDSQCQHGRSHRRLCRLPWL